MSDFKGLVTLTLSLTLDRVILHTFMHQSSTSTYILNFIKDEETICGRTDLRTGERTFETHFIRSTRRSRPKNWLSQIWPPLCVKLLHLKTIVYLSFLAMVSTKRFRFEETIFPELQSMLIVWWRIRHNVADELSATLPCASCGKIAGKLPRNKTRFTRNRVFI